MNYTHQPMKTEVTIHTKSKVCDGKRMYTGYVKVTHYTGDAKKSYTYQSRIWRLTRSDAHADATCVYNQLH